MRKPFARRSRCSALQVAFLALVFLGADAWGGAPYPPSPVIREVRWAPADTVVRRAAGSDNWAVTWADDDALYTTWGDGWGFEPRTPQKMSLGFARLEGPPGSFTGTNIPATVLGAKNLSPLLGDGRRGRKGWGMLCVEGVLYLAMGHADGQGGQSQLAWSRDHGRTWEFADWVFPQFGLVGFVNYGKDYRGARDDYVYAYSHDGPQADAPADRFVLLRAPKSRLAERSAWEFFARLEGTGQAVWTSDVERRGAVFSHRDGCLRSAMTYNAPLCRYLWWQQIPAPPGREDRGDTRFEGGFGVYDAPEPWGPWSTAFYTERWDLGPGEHADFPAQWMSPDGCEVHLLFSGNDACCVRQATLVLASPPQMNQVPSPMADAIRAHERVEKKDVPGVALVLNEALSKPVDVYFAEPKPELHRMDLLIHFHGASYVPKQAAYGSGHPLIVAVVNLGSGSAVYEKEFRDESTFPGLVETVRDAVSRRAATKTEISRVYLSSFSAGYGAVRAILKHHQPMVDGIMLLDGLHTDYVPAGRTLSQSGVLNAEKLAGFLEFARLATEGKKRFLMTHSEIFPGTYASTTECADYLINALHLQRHAVLQWGPVGMQMLSETKHHGLTILGFAGNSAPDHIDHLHGLSAFLKMILDRDRASERKDEYLLR